MLELYFVCIANEKKKNGERKLQLCLFKTLYSILVWDFHFTAFHNAKINYKMGKQEKMFIEFSGWNENKITRRVAWECGINFDMIKTITTINKVNGWLFCMRIKWFSTVKH